MRKYTTQRKMAAKPATRKTTVKLTWDDEESAERPKSTSRIKIHPNFCATEGKLQDEYTPGSSRGGPSTEPLMYARNEESLEEIIPSLAKLMKDCLIFARSSGSRLNHRHGRSTAFKRLTS